MSSESAVLEPNSAFWSNRPVLVTGGAGFIGSHLVEALVAAGANVRVLCHYNSAGLIGHLEPLVGTGADVDLRLGDISDQSFVRECVRGTDTVFHLAALIGIPYSYVAPSHYVDVNVRGTLAVLEAGRSDAVRRLVHTSTSECFGSAQYTPIDELHPLVAQSPYAATKIAADQLVGSYFRSFGTPAVIIRPFNTFGPRQSQRAVIPTVIGQLILGPKVRLGSVDPIRDMNPVYNTVDAFLRAGSTPDIEGETFVIGSGVGRSIAEIVSVVGSRLGVEAEIEIEPGRVRPAPSEVDRLICDFTKARRWLGYAPSMGFEEGIDVTIRYIRESPPRRLGYAI